MAVMAVCREPRVLFDLRRVGVAKGADAVLAATADQKIHRWSIRRPTAASGSGLQPPQANGGCSEVKGQHCATSGASSPHAGTPAAAAFRAAMKRAAAEPADDRFAGHGGGGNGAASPTPRATRTSRRST